MLKLLIAEDEHLALDMLSSIGMGEYRRCGSGQSGKRQRGAGACQKRKAGYYHFGHQNAGDGWACVSRDRNNLLPDTKFIILSAYNEFEYAQRAVNCGVFEYILKPYTADELLNVAERAVADIMVQRQKDEFVEGLMNRLEFSKYFFLNYFLNSLSSGGA